MGKKTTYRARAHMPPQLPDRTKRKLQRLLERRRQLEADYVQAVDALAAAACQVSDEEGWSRGSVAEALGVGTSTVQGWVVRGRQLAANRKGSVS